MQRIVIHMKSYLMSDAVQMALKGRGDFHLTLAEEATDLPKKCFHMAATILLMEVGDGGVPSLDERLRIGREVRQKCPDCKIVLIVDENADRAATERVKRAKMDGQIDQFIYSSTSAAYLAAILETL